MAELKENVIEWYNNESMALVTLNQGRYISRVRKYAKEYPDECEIVAENPDGSICAHIPLKWIKISKVNREVSEEQKKVYAERMRQMKMVF